MLRLIDANIDRAGEGLRVLEDAARFLLNDADLTRRFKELRHDVSSLLRPLEDNLLAARDARGDVGAPALDREAVRHEDLVGMLRANARRVEQSLRVLEEFARWRGAGLQVEPVSIEQARYKVYDLEKELVLGAGRMERRRRLRGLYLVLDVASLGGRDPADVAGAAIRGGASTIQLRAKGLDKGEMLRMAHAVGQACSAGKALFIINDHVDIALAAGADGVHLGQTDLPVSEARRLLPLDRLIGCTARSVSQAKQAQEEGADYVAVGSMFPTATKDGAVVVGPSTLREISEAVSVPVLAIGGITGANLAEVMGNGAAGVAVVSAVIAASDVEEAARNLSSRIREFLEGKAE